MESHAHIPEDVQDAGRKAKRTARNAASNRWITLFARLGYAAKGIVYLIIGGLAVLLAFGQGGKATDQHGALQAIYEQPFGKTLLIVVAIGLLGFALWCFLQAVFDAEGKGSKAKGIIARIGYTGTGIAYTALAFGAFQVATASGSGGKGSTASTQDATALLLKQPLGVALVVIVGLVVIGIAFYLFYKAYTAHFQRQLNLVSLSTQLRKGMVFLGRLGYAALGVVFSVIGFFLIVAALRHNPQQAEGLDSALRTLLHQPYGSVLLAIVAFGLFAYGIYSFVEAYYRRVGVS